jgi:HAD superfamily hydrolase (TIGR01509 family)
MRRVSGLVAGARGVDCRDGWARHVAADQARVFDLGGVLVRITRSWAEAHERASLPTGDREPSPSVVAAIAKLTRQLERGDLSPDDFCRQYAATSGGAYSVAAVHATLDAVLIKTHPGVETVLDVLEATGVATGILSNTNPRHWAHPLQAELRARVRHAHASHLLRAIKPEPAIYERFEAATGADAGAILFFDDGEPNVDAARARGWRAEYIDHAGDTAAQLLDALRAHGVIEAAR